jgi:asparagine synthase (glutamine-hydrolysing)
MCGICGFAGDGTSLSREDLVRMTEAIARRGPDDEGYLTEPGIGLGMRRLSILDLEGGHQPITNEDGSVAVVFNGEIYNYLSLRSDLLSRGHTFRTRSDTEVLAHLYEDHGKNMVRYLRGMFAFAVWDRRRRSLLLARDRLGIKPLYYAPQGGSLIFASEIKAILQAGIVPTDLDWQAIDAYLAFTYIPGPRTIYGSVAKLRPGHLLVYRDGTSVEEPYWDVRFPGAANTASEAEWKTRIEDKLLDAVQSHLVSDVPLGAFLSGGVDSSLVVSMMAKITGRPVQAFTMGFSGTDLVLRDERPYARMLAGMYPVEFNEFTVQPDFRGILDEILCAFDEPFADDSVIPTYYISKLTRQKVKVALSGLGGDELFGGYHRYQGLLLSAYTDHIPRRLRSDVINPLVQALPEARGGGDRIDHVKRFWRSSPLSPDQRYLGYVSSLDVEERKRLYLGDMRRRVDFDTTSSVITGPFSACESESLVDRAIYTDLKTYLPDDILTLSDRLSMWHSLELRVPLIDHELVELAATLPGRYKVRPSSTKWLLKKIASGSLPQEIIRHRKQGFESPMASWLRLELDEFAQETLSDPAVAEMWLFNPEEIGRLLDEHRSGRRKNNKILFSLIILFRWLRMNLL